MTTKDGHTDAVIAAHYSNLLRQGATFLPGDRVRTRGGTEITVVGARWDGPTELLVWITDCGELVSTPAVWCGLI